MKEKKLKAKSRIKNTKRKFNMRDFAIVVIPSLILLITVAMIYFVTQNFGTYHIEGEAIQYYADQEFKIPNSTKIKHRSDKYMVSNGDVQYELDPMPIYYQGKDILVTATDMVYFAPREGIIAKVNGLNDIDYSNNGLVLKDGHKSKDMKPGFLFDGKNVYIFLEPVTLKFDGYSFKLGKMSYVEANNSHEIMIYNNDTHEMMMKQPNTKVLAETSNGEYTVSLLSDSMEMNDGSKMLLFNRPDQLDLYFK